MGFGSGGAGYQIRSCACLMNSACDFYGCGATVPGGGGRGFPVASLGAGCGCWGVSYSVHGLLAQVLARLGFPVVNKGAGCCLWGLTCAS